MRINRFELGPMFCVERLGRKPKIAEEGSTKDKPTTRVITMAVIKAKKSRAVKKIIAAGKGDQLVRAAFTTHGVVVKAAGRTYRLTKRIKRVDD